MRQFPEPIFLITISFLRVRSIQTTVCGIRPNPTSDFVLNVEEAIVEN